MALLPFSLFLVLCCLFVYITGSFFFFWFVAVSEGEDGAPALAGRSEMLQVVVPDKKCD